MATYPVMLHIDGEDCLVVGGGAVARRKVTSLLQANGKVTVIAPKICPEIENLRDDGLIDIFHREYREGDVRGFFLIIAATNSRGVNLGIAEEARREGVLVNVTDHFGQSSFTVPSVLRRGDLTVAVGTCGKSPLLARRVRESIERQIPQNCDELLGDLWAARETFKDAPEKMKIYDEIIRGSGWVE